MSYINFYTYRLKDEQLDALYIRNLVVLLFLPPTAGTFESAVTTPLTPLTKQRTSGVVTAGVGGYITVERAVMRAHLTTSLCNLHEAVDDDAAIWSSALQAYTHSIG